MSPGSPTSVSRSRHVHDAREIYYPGAPHGMTATIQDQINADLLAFIQS